MKSRIKIAAMTGAIAALIFTAGCSKKAEGQVVAVVNGEEISLQELNAELQGVNVPEGADKKALMAGVLQRVIDRRLMAQQAKDEGIDRDPAFISQQRRLTEELLVSMSGKKAASSIKVPDQREIEKFMTSNPTMFGGRTKYKVDQIQFDRPADLSQLKALEGDHSMAAVASTLTRLNIKFQQGTSALDSGTVPPALLKQILSLPAGEPFIVPNGNKVVVSVITGSEPLAVPVEQARPLAVQAMRNEELNKIGETRLKEAKAKAKIEYQAGYEPPADKKPATAAK